MVNIAEVQLSGPAARPAEPNDNIAVDFAFLGRLVAIDNPASSALTRDRLGWKPEGPELIPDIDEGHYFNKFTARVRDAPRPPGIG